MLKNLLKDMLKEEFEESVGAICEDCNQTAYYFKDMNRKLFSSISCLICSEEKRNGVLLEDFIFTLNGHCDDHYIFGENKTSKTVSLNDILKRFTYNNKEVLKKLSDLLCKENPAFFQENGFYQNIVDDEFIQKCKKEAIEEWDSFAKELKHKHRFTNKRALNFYEGLISSCIHSEKKDDKKIIVNSVSKIIPKGTVFYRGRLSKGVKHQEAILAKPENELSAPPDNLAGNGRMSPSGISFMYTANTPKTAIAELHPYIGDIIAIGGFINTKELNFFDFTLLDSIQIKEANILTNPKKDKYFQNTYILNFLHGLISKPLRANDLSYIETQMFAEIIRNYNYDNVKFDGIIFKSSQNEKGLNYVLFGDYLDNDEKAYHLQLNYDDNKKAKIEFHKIIKVEADTEIHFLT